MLLLLLRLLLLLWCEVSVATTITSNAPRQMNSFWLIIFFVCNIIQCNFIITFHRNDMDYTMQLMANFQHKKTQKKILYNSNIGGTELCEIINYNEWRNAHLSHNWINDIELGMEQWKGSCTSSEWPSKNQHKMIDFSNFGLLGVWCYLWVWKFGFWPMVLMIISIKIEMYSQNGRHKYFLGQRCDTYSKAIYTQITSCDVRLWEDEQNERFCGGMNGHGMKWIVCEARAGNTKMNACDSKINIRIFFIHCS